VRGRILLDGRELLGLGERELREIRGRRIAAIFQSPVSSFNPVFRVGDVFVRALMLHGATSKDEARERAAEELRSVLLSPDLLARYPHELSGGQAQRVAIALALALRSDVLLADEPTSALDVTVQAEILELVRSLRDGHGMSVLFISHDLAVISELCNRIVVMRRGRIVEQGDVAAVLTAPEHEYTRALVAAIPKVGRSARG
jgi:ABC-type glutathione transport system ATPase component